MIGIVGVGTVGKAVLNGIEKHRSFLTELQRSREVNCWTYDPFVEAHKEPPTTAELLSTDAVFLAVNTPSDSSGYNLNATRDALSNLLSWGYRGVVVLHSTIDLHSYRQLQEFVEDRLTLVYSPEFLTEKNANDDYYNAEEVFYGTEYQISEVQEKVVEQVLSLSHKPGARIIKKSLLWCVQFKTNRNLALSLKVLTANIIHQGCVMNGMTASEAQSLVNDIFTMDSRLRTENPYHTVAADGNYGFGGKCLPKDLVAKAGEFHNMIMEHAVAGSDTEIEDLPYPHNLVLNTLSVLDTIVELNEKMQLTRKVD